jgi:Tfp pilus assembly protein PilX
MIRPLQSQSRQGYSLTVVLIFLILLFALWSTVYRSTSSVLRIETNRALQQTRDQGAMNALGQALQLLQYSTPSNSSNQFVYYVKVCVTELGATDPCTIPTYYTVQFTQEPQHGPNRWKVQVNPGNNATFPLPDPVGNVLWP